MLKYLTLRNKLDYSFTSFITYMANNIWVYLCWVFSTYLLPVGSVLGIMFLMVLFDFITGVWKASKKGLFSSGRILDSIEKLLLYTIGVIASLVLQVHIGIDFLKPLWLFTTLVITREYVSVVENIEEITGTRLVEVIKSQLAKILPESAKKKDCSND